MNLYYAPTRVSLEKGAEKRVADELVKEGAKKVLIHYGSERIRKTGLLSEVETLLKEKGIEYVELGGVVPNPRLSLVKTGIELCRKEKVDFLLAIGGGSVIDSTKAIGYGLAFDGDVWDFFLKKCTPKGCYPIGCILTQAAAGSEMSDSCVITNEEGWLKRGVNTDYVRLKFALLDPELTYTLPPYQTAAATVDIMMHTMERYFINGETLPLTDNLALALLKTVAEAGAKALKCPTDYDARANLMWASSLSHNGLMAVGNENRGDWAPHQLEHELSGMFDMAHGAGLAAIWSSWARYVKDVQPERFIAFGRAVFNLGENSSADDAIDATEAFFKSLGMPVRVKEAGIELSKEQIATLAHKCSFFGTRTIGAFKTLNEEDMKNIYTMAR
jgi:Uncharacterized oxidoreductases, Fe-dependent alcohol dehydrogenase family